MLKFFILLTFLPVLGLSQSEDKDLYPKKNKNGAKIYYEYVYGLSAWGISCQKSIDIYQYDTKAIAGCVVTKRLVFKAKRHNFWVHIVMRSKYGVDWEYQIRETCNP